MNYFVDYLNSTNNVGGNSTGSLAETQVKSSFYDSVKVDRNLGSYIIDCINARAHKAFILTGHAGDGKTSILVQVLKATGRLKDGEGLEVQKEYDDFFYVKDMSEIAADKQSAALQDAITAPQRGKTSLLISNTGPLLKAFEELVRDKRIAEGKEFSATDRMALQSLLLTQLDANKDQCLNIEGFEIILVNIARVDNVPFAVRILKNVLAPELWEPCKSCSCSNRCPIHNNYNLISTFFDRIAFFVEHYYRYLYENDKRMTIRQMVGQLSYALTGNLTCQDIAKRRFREPFFNFNFANLFFGYHGTKKAADAAQIKGIAQIQNLELDRIALNIDYALFVRHDYSCFPPSVRTELEAFTNRSRKHYQITEENGANDSDKLEKELKFRRAVRRFYLFYSLYDGIAELKSLMNQVFGEAYTDYVDMITKKQPKIMLKRMGTTVFDALYVKNTGYLPDGKNDLPLTLRREDDVFQNVMIVLGEVHKGSFDVLQEKVSSHFEDVPNKYNVYLSLEGTPFNLSLPMMTYFHNLIDGSISSNSNPALTHGIAQLDALLLEKYGEDRPESADDCDLTVIINTTHGQEFEHFAFEGKNLII